MASYEDFTGAKDAGSSPPPPPHRCDVLPSSKVGQHDVTLVLVKPEDECFWVARDETSVETYREFLDDEEGAGSVDWTGRALGDHCQWKTGVSDPETEQDHPCTEEVEKESNGFEPAKPIRCVDWCDAAAFCNWAGMELCLDGRTMHSTVPVDPVDEWGKACAPNALAYGYGTQAERGRCNIGECVSNANQPCAPVTPETYEDCVSPAGARNMLGNVSEWVRWCAGIPEPDIPNAFCATRGGSYADELATTCNEMSGDFIPRNERRPTLGFRCCSRLSADEAASLE